MKRLAATLAFGTWLTLLHPLAALAQGEPWVLGVGAGTFYESLAGGDESRGDVGGTLQASLARNLTFGPRGSLKLSGNVSKDFYDLTHFWYGLNVSGSYLITPRLSWTITDAVSSSFGQNNTLLTDAGIVLPYVDTLTHDLSTNFGYLLSPRTDMHVGFGSQTVGFDSSIFTGGSNLSTTVGLGRRLTASQTLGVDYRYQRTNNDGGGAAGIQTVAALWHLTKGRASFNAAGGIGAYTQPDRDNYAFTPVSSVDWTMQFNKTHSILLSYSNRVEQGFGFDFNQVTQTVAATYALTYRFMTLALGTNYSRSSDPLVSDRLYLSGPANASVHFALRRNLSLGLDSTLFLTKLPPGPWTLGYRAAMLLSYSKGFR